MGSGRMEGEESFVEGDLMANRQNTERTGPDTPVVQQVQQQIRPVVEQTQQRAGEMMDQARTQVVSQLENQKERATGGLGTVAHALRQTGQQLREKQQEGIAQYTDRAAETVERFSEYLNGRDVHQLIGEVEEYARRQPAVFLAGAFALGFLAARFLKSSRPGGSPSAAAGRFESRSQAAGMPAGRYGAVGGALGQPTEAVPAVAATPVAAPAPAAAPATPAVMPAPAAIDLDRDEEEELAPAGATTTTASEFQP